MAESGDVSQRALYRWASQLLEGQSFLRGGHMHSEHQTMQQVSITIDGIPLDIELANALAEQVAKRLADDFLLLAWYDGQREEEHPSVPECQHKPGWLAYAEGHGGNIRVRINDGEFDFIFVAV